MNRKLFTAIMLVVSILVGTFVLAMPASTNASAGFERKRGANPAPTPSPGAKRPKPIQSPRPKRGL